LLKQNSHDLPDHANDTGLLPVSFRNSFPITLNRDPITGPRFLFAIDLDWNAAPTSDEKGRLGKLRHIDTTTIL